MMEHNGDLSIYNEVQIRWMIKDDIDSVMIIEKRSFQFKWTRSNFIKTLQSPNCIGQVAIINDKIVGYIIYEIYDSYYEILNLNIDPTCRRQRIGTMLLNKILRKLDLDERKSVLFCVREKNLAGQLFLKKQQFLCTDILDNYYNKENEPAYLMEFKLDV